MVAVGAAVLVALATALAGPVPVAAASVPPSEVTPAATALPLPPGSVAAVPALTSVPVQPAVPRDTALPGRLAAARGTAPPGHAPAAPAAAAGAPLHLPQVWTWPLLPAPRVLRAFDNPAKPWLPGHRGVDLAALPGQPVLAAASGVVVFAGLLAGRGVVSIEHGGIRSSYEPVVPLVKPGDPVVIGRPIALVAAVPPHCGVRVCLHWGAFESLSVPRRYLDPRLLVHAGPVRLVPTRG